MIDDNDCEDATMCPECGDMVPEFEISAHDGVCKQCYDDNHFGEDPPFDEED